MNACRHTRLPKPFDLKCKILNTQQFSMNRWLSKMIKPKYRCTQSTQELKGYDTEKNEQNSGSRVVHDYSDVTHKSDVVYWLIASLNDY